MTGCSIEYDLFHERQLLAQNASRGSLLVSNLLTRLDNLKIPIQTIVVWDILVTDELEN